MESILEVQLKDQLTAIVESFESRNKDEVKIIGAAESEFKEMLKYLVQTFFCKTVNNSEICKYWEVILKIIRFLKDVIWDWTKHSKVSIKIKITNDDSISPCHEWNKNEKNERMNERKNETTQIWEELKLFLEEADTQIIPRFSYSILNGYKRIVVIKWHRSLCTDSSLYVCVLR